MSVRIKNRGRTFSGVRTNTNTQFRKHVTQMTKEDLAKCCILLKDIKKLDRSEHLRKKRSVKFSMNTVYNTLKHRELYKNIIEYNERYDSPNDRWRQRVLIHIPVLEKFMDRGEEKEGYLKVVIDVTTKEVITAYFNVNGDNHKTLNKSKYTKSLKVRKPKKGGYNYPNPGLDKEVVEKLKAIS